MQEDHGSVGCSTDVLPVLDRKCTGRHTCQMTIPDATLHAIQMCPRELIPYLEASYDCVQGIFFYLYRKSFNIIIQYLNALAEQTATQLAL